MLMIAKNMGRENQEWGLGKVGKRLGIWFHKRSRNPAYMVPVTFTIFVLLLFRT